MALDLKKLSKNFKKALKNITQEDIDKYFPPRGIKKGWVSIEDHLPMMYAIDIMHGYTKYRVKYADGKEGETGVADHNTWYFRAKEEGITHWYCEEDC